MRSPALSRALTKSKTRTVLAAAGVAAVVGAATFAGGLAFAAGGLNPPAENPAVVYAPSAIPDRVILTPSTTPAVTQNVSWRTATGVAAKVQLSPLTKGPVTATGTFDATTTVQFSTDLGYDIAYHTATLTGLAPATGYLYRVGDGDTWSEWFEFQTAADGAQDFSFLIQGDAQNDIKSYASRTFRAAFEARPYAKAGVRVLKAADLTEIANFSAHAYGNKVYGVSVDSAKGVVYVSARDRYPTAIIALQRAAK
ncbi:fibronectin type III domain-containing protein [Leifsonia aquatica]|uniref:fibronectin type III domain-containing protein n=1 Tax=Leifsonia aquatica TaxID=144185 RepID=UPI0028B22433|nr:fibronectin type III domain-containing protein [Leifsonia aquatica]